MKLSLVYCSVFLLLCSVVVYGKPRPDVKVKRGEKQNADPLSTLVIINSNARELPADEASATSESEAPTETDTPEASAESEAPSDPEPPTESVAPSEPSSPTGDSVHPPSSEISSILGGNVDYEIEIYQLAHEEHNEDTKSQRAQNIPADILGIIEKLLSSHVLDRIDASN